MWTSIVLPILAVFVLNLAGTPQKNNADGLTQLENREGNMFVKISHLIYTTQTECDAYMQFSKNQIIIS